MSTKEIRWRGSRVAAHTRLRECLLFCTDPEYAYSLMGKPGSLTAKLSASALAVTGNNKQEGKHKRQQKTTIGFPTSRVAAGLACVLCC